MKRLLQALAWVGHRRRAVEASAERACLAAGDLRKELDDPDSPGLRAAIMLLAERL